MRVENMTSSKGNAVANQFLIHTDKGVYFQSYRTIIAFRPNAGKVQLDINAWDYSVTTGKYRNAFLEESKRETEQNIKDGNYEMVNLNA